MLLKNVLNSAGLQRLNVLFDVAIKSHTIYKLKIVAQEGFVGICIFEPSLSCHRKTNYFLIRHSTRALCHFNLMSKFRRFFPKKYARQLSFSVSGFQKFENFRVSLKPNRPSVACRKLFGDGWVGASAGCVALP